MKLNYQQFSLCFGFFVWLLATLIVKHYGHYLFSIENTTNVILLYIGICPLLYALIHYVFKRFRLNDQSRLRSAVLMAIPGMLFDVLCIKFHGIVFPLLSQEQVLVLGSWIIWAYLIVILVGLYSKTKSTT
jgi:hypothetical protein